MHLHSFTYDYHLRCLHQFITNQKPLLRHGYHIVDFIDDFMRYYPKAPNYARSLVHTGKEILYPYEEKLSIKLFFSDFYVLKNIFVFTLYSADTV